MNSELTFTAISEARPGPKWLARWAWSWPAYRAWFEPRSKTNTPSLAHCEKAIGKYMPELMEPYRRLCQLTGGGELAARFLSGWCPPAYLGGCSIAAAAKGGDVRLVRNYDLSPDLNEGLLLRSEWTGRAVMGMVEFLWGLSDGVNDAGLCVALAFGGSGTVRPGFGVTHILRYVLETCNSVADALTVLRRVPSHMDYNLVLADRTGWLASVELLAGGGIRLVDKPIATNHQHGGEMPRRAAFTKTHERRVRLEQIVEQEAPEALRSQFLAEPLHQTNYAEGFGTLFTVEYRPVDASVMLAWPKLNWEQALNAFEEGTRHICYSDFAGGQLPKWQAGYPFFRADKLQGTTDDWICAALRIAEFYSSGWGGSSRNTAADRYGGDHAYE